MSDSQQIAQAAAAAAASAATEAGTPSNTITHILKVPNEEIHNHCARVQVASPSVSSSSDIPRRPATENGKANAASDSSNAGGDDDDEIGSEETKKCENDSELRGSWADIFGTESDYGGLAVLVVAVTVLAVVVRVGAEVFRS